MANDRVILWQMPPAWGLPNPSPFCLKLETWLRMTDIPYEAKKIEGPPKSATGKVPYIDRPGGGLLWDSDVIIDTLTKERNVTLDAGLTDEQRAIGTLVQRTLEDSLYFCVLWDRWCDPAGWALTEPAYFGSFPWFIRKVIVPTVRRKVIGAAHAQGIGRMTKEEIHAKGVRDVQAIATLLGNRTYLFDRPSRFDAILYAFIENLLRAPMTSRVTDATRAARNLVAHAEGMKETYWKGWQESKT